MSHTNPSVFSNVAETKMIVGTLLDVFFFIHHAWDFDLGLRILLPNDSSSCPTSVVFIQNLGVKGVYSVGSDVIEMFCSRHL